MMSNMMQNPYVDLFDQRDSEAYEAENLCPECMTNELREGEVICKECFDGFVERLMELHETYPQKYWERLEDLLEGSCLTKFFEEYEFG